ncbi:MAG TPA: hypothetical protein VK577_16740, partial [Bradyrhizobium sp.]|nr:hypothetical protein [Bradyrhizobium sp.]
MKIDSLKLSWILGDRRRWLIARDYPQGIFRSLIGIMNVFLWLNVQIEPILIGHKKIRRKQRLRRIDV